ncbi:hypothetical protein BC940DRAFT_313260 [Gongronella butleri]|nr:hypothetical protein BC940DRAFT_313260 [Gongronella butleri]
MTNTSESSSPQVKRSQAMRDAEGKQRGGAMSKARFKNKSNEVQDQFLRTTSYSDISRRNNGPQRGGRTSFTPSGLVNVETRVKSQQPGFRMDAPTPSLAKRDGVSAREARRTSTSGVVDIEGQPYSRHAPRSSIRAAEYIDDEDDFYPYDRRSNSPPSTIESRQKAKRDAAFKKLLSSRAKSKASTSTTTSTTKSASSPHRAVPIHVSLSDDDENDDFVVKKEPLRRKRPRSVSLSPPARSPPLLSSSKPSTASKPRSPSPLAPRDSSDDDDIPRMIIPKRRTPVAVISSAATAAIGSFSRFFGTSIDKTDTSPTNKKHLRDNNDGDIDIVGTTSSNTYTSPPRRNPTRQAAQKIRHDTLTDTENDKKMDLFHEIDDDGHDDTPTREFLFTYPFDHRKGSITVTGDDLKRLKPEEFLNDTIIEVYLRKVHDEYKEDANYKRAKLADDTHIFSPFFYTRLTKGIIDNDVIDYDGVQKWTTDIDLFSKKYVFIPVLEHSHWYLLLVTNLHKCLENVPRSAAPEDRPKVFVLDSIGARHRQTARNVVQYLKMEAKNRLGIEELATAPVNYPTDVPQQPNYHDCGLFVLHFVDQFFKSSDDIIRALFKKDKSAHAWATRDLDSKRMIVRAIFISLMAKYREGQPPSV